MGTCASVNRNDGEEDPDGKSKQGIQPFKEAAEKNRTRRKRHQERVAEYRRVSEAHPDATLDSDDDCYDDDISVSCDPESPLRYGMPHYDRTLSPVPERSVSPSAVSTGSPATGSILLTGAPDGTPPRAESPSKETNESDRSPSVVFVVAPRRPRDVSRSRSVSPSMTPLQASQQFAAGHRSPRTSFDGTEDAPKCNDFAGGSTSNTDDGVTMTTFRTSFSQRREQELDDELAPPVRHNPDYMQQQPQDFSQSGNFLGGSISNSDTPQQLLSGSSLKIEDDVANRRSFDNRNSFNEGGGSESGYDDCEEPELLPVDDYEADRRWRGKIAKRGYVRRAMFE